MMENQKEALKFLKEQRDWDFEQPISEYAITRVMAQYAAHKLKNHSDLSNVRYFYLVILEVDYEGIMEDMWLFESLEKAEVKLKELTESNDYNGYDYRIKKLNCI